MQSIRKFIKISVLVLAIIPILMFLGFSAAVSFIDFNRYKPQIEQQVAKLTGREMQIEGAIEVAVFPFALEVGQTYFKNSAEFTQPYLLSLGKTHIQFSVWDLLVHKHLSVVSLELIEPSLHLVKTPTGNNWSDLQALLALWPNTHGTPSRTANLFSNSLSDLINPALAQSATDAGGFRYVNATQAVSQPVDTGNSVNGLAASSDLLVWAIESLVVQKGAVTFTDEVKGQTVFFEAINVLALDIQHDAPFKASLDFQHRHSEYPQRYAFNINSHLQLSEALSRWTFNEWDGLLKITLPAERNIPEVRVSTSGERLSLDVNTQQVEMVNGQFKGLEASIVTRFSGQYGTAAQLNGWVDAKGINFKNWAYHLGIDLPKFVDPKALTHSTGQFDWAWHNQKLSLTNLNLSLDKARLRGEYAQQFGEAPRIEFALKAAQIDLDAYMAYATPKVVKVNESANLNANLTAKIATPAEIDLTRPGQTALAPAQAERSATQIATQDNASVNAEPELYLPIAVPVSTLRAMDAKGHLQVTRFKVLDIQAESLQVELTAKDGQMQFAPLDGLVYQGALQSRFDVDVRGDTPAFKWQGKVSELAVAPLLADGWQIKPLSGQLKSHFNLQTRGSNQVALKHNLNGHLLLTVAPGAFYGLQLNALLTGMSPSMQASTGFNELVLMGDVREGVLDVSKLTLAAEGFSGVGAAKVDLNHATLSSRLNVRLDKPSAELAPLAGLVVPIALNGPLNDTQWSANTAGLLKDLSIKAN
jgi:AsmA protein